MKQLFILSISTLLFQFTIAQSAEPTIPNHADPGILNSIIQSMKKFESEYNCKKRNVGNEVRLPNAVSDYAFDSVYKLSTLRILSSSQDVIKNGRAATLDFNEALKRLSINYAWQGKNEKFWNAGFVAEEGSKKLFEIFGKKGWKEGFTFSLGQAVPVGAKSIFYLTDNCESLVEKRKNFYLVLLDKYAQVLATDKSRIDNIKARKAAAEAVKFDEVMTHNDIPSQITPGEATLLALWEKLTNPPTDLTDIYEKDVSDFEIANFPNLGYKVKWINWSASGGLKRFTIYDTAVVNLAQIKKKNLPRFTITGSYNMFRESAKDRITYLAGEASAGNTNYLEEILPGEITQLKSSTTPDIIKEDYEALVIKDYETLKKWYGYVSFGGVFNYFPGKIGKLGRFLGIELAASTKHKFFVPEGVNARDVFSCRGGLLFTFEDDKVAKTSIGIIAALTDIPYNDITSKDRFSVSVRIGVPFNY